jgi:hypothetical protein
MTKIPMIALARACAGGCGEQVEYLIEVGLAPYVPDMHFPGVAYKGGHLCPACQALVEAALAVRRRNNPGGAVSGRSS